MFATPLTVSVKTGIRDCSFSFARKQRKGSTVILVQLRSEGREMR